ncbi:Uncharacterised protein [Chlamydia trachomatis]|nr:Uncharacterised protein [Chlamydia trachomatis]
MRVLCAIDEAILLPAQTRLPHHIQERVPAG